MHRILLNLVSGRTAEAARVPPLERVDCSLSPKIPANEKKDSQQSLGLPEIERLETPDFRVADHVSTFAHGRHTTVIARSGIKLRLERSCAS